MSISALDNPSDELVAAIQNHRREIRRKLKRAGGDKNYRMGYGAFLDGFDPTDSDLKHYDSPYPGYAKGWKDAQRDEGAAA